MKPVIYVFMLAFSTYCLADGWQPDVDIVEYFEQLGAVLWLDQAPGT